MLSFPPTASRRARPRRRAFSLVELLAVLAVIVLLLGVALPAVTSMKGAGDVTKAAYDLAGVLQQARAYAMANNTYVYVGVAEVDVTRASGGTQTAGNGLVGRVGVGVVATRDGTQGFGTGSLQNWSSAYPAFAADHGQVGKPLVLDNLHVPDLGPPPASGGMARPALSSPASGMSYSVGNANCVSATPFDYPLGTALGAGQYSFKKVIQFDPQGVARIQNASTPGAITTYLEIGLQPSHAATVAALPASPTTGNIAAIQIDGMTGTTRIYRP